MVFNTLVRFRYFTLLIGATFISSFWTVALNHQEFSAAETLIFSLYIASILLVQMCILKILFLLQKVGRLFSIPVGLAASAFITMNVYTVIIINNARFTAMDLWPSLGVILSMGVAVAIVVFVSNKNFVKFTHVFLIIMTGLIGLQLIGNSKDYIKGIFDRIPTHFKFVEFEKKSNVYIISLDALSPEAVVQKNIGQERVPYVEAFKRHNMRFISNSFAERVPTKRALNLLLAMDKNYYDSVQESSGFVRDQVPNPTYEIFRKNGYKIQFVYSNSYFGDDGGRLDYYGIAKAFGLCKHVEKKYAFMGYCLEYVQQKVKKYIKIKNQDYPQMLFDRIQQTAKSNDRWFTFASIYAPGHAKNSTQYNNPKDWDEYRQLFKKKSKNVVTTIDKLINVIKENDPEAITIIFGDHGSLLTLGALKDQNGLAADALDFDINDFPEDSLVNFKQTVHDRHAVLNVMMPAKACPDQFNHSPYSTMRLMRDLIMCLSGNQDPLPAEYQADDSRWAPYMYE